MRRLETRLEGPILLEPAVHGDDRGFFIETYRRTFMELDIQERWCRTTTRAPGGASSAASTRSYTCG